MRPEVRELFEASICAVISGVRAAIRPLVQIGQDVDLTTSAFLWNVLQEAANRVKEDLQSTPEGRMVLERGERARVGRRPN